MKTKSINLPHFIIKKSKKYYQNTLSGEYIRAEQIQVYLDHKRQQDRQRQIIFK